MRLGDFVPLAQAALLFGSRQARSNGSRQACGAISWCTGFGPQDPCSYKRTGGGD